jgi:hypothetical protein
LLIDEGPRMIRLATDTAIADESADPTTAESVRDFVSSLAETSTV